MKSTKPILIAVTIFVIAAIAAFAWAYHVTVASLTPKAQFSLYDKGTESIVDYNKYGVFENEGTVDFKYRIKDRKGLPRL